MGYKFNIYMSGTVRVTAQCDSKVNHVLYAKHVSVEVPQSFAM